MPDEEMDVNQAQEEQPEERARGFLLAGWIVLMLMHNAMVGVFTVAGALKYGSAILGALALLMLVNCALLLAVFTWKKWGFVGLCAAYGLGTVVGVVPQGPGLMRLMPLVPLFVLGALVWPKWDLFA